MLSDEGASSSSSDTEAGGTSTAAAGSGTGSRRQAHQQQQQQQQPSQQSSQQSRPNRKKQRQQQPSPYPDAFQLSPLPGDFGRRYRRSARNTGPSSGSTLRIAAPLLLQPEIARLLPIDLTGIDSDLKQQNRDAAASHVDRKAGAARKPFFIDEHTHRPSAALPASDLWQCSPSILSNVELSYDYHEKLRAAAIAYAHKQRSARYAGRETDAQSNSIAAHDSIMSRLLLGYLNGVSGTDGVPNASHYVQFSGALESALENYAPMSLVLSPYEQVHYDKVAQLCMSLCQNEAVTENVRLRLRDLVLCYWLSSASPQHILAAVKFALLQHSRAATLRDASPLHCAGYVSDYCQRVSAYRRRLLRLDKSKHCTDLPVNARTVRLWPKPSSNRVLADSTAVRLLHHGRKWEWEDDGGWEKHDDRVSALLEAAYQAGKPTVEFTVDGQRHLYTADFVRMVQRASGSNRERPLRSLLALLIREPNGVISQTVEINMPHDTLIRELRKELANYLKHDERFLRMMYGKRVLKRDEYSQLTIRQAIVPLGADPLVVTKLNKGAQEDLCTFVLTNTHSVRQPAYECLTCDYVDGRTFCQVCAQQCHATHVTRLVSQSSLSFCHCGAGSGGSEQPCRALEDSTEIDSHQPARLAVSPNGHWLFVLSSEHGLMRIGTGKGGTVLGKLNGQNSTLACHAGAHFVCLGDTLLLRSPLSGPDMLLVVDAWSLRIKGERVLFDSNRDVCMQRIVSWLNSNVNVEYCIRGDTDETEGGDGLAATLSEIDESAANNNGTGNHWAPLPHDLAFKLRHVLCSDWQYGDMVWQSEHDHSTMSVVLEEEGLFLRRQTKLGIRRSRLRLRRRDNVLPMHVHDGKLLVLNLDSLHSADTPTTARSVANNPQRRREHALVADVYSMPDSLNLRLQHCAACGRVMSGGSGECNACDHDLPLLMPEAATGELDGDLRRQLARLHEQELQSGRTPQQTSTVASNDDLPANLQHLNLSRTDSHPTVHGSEGDSWTSTSLKLSQQLSSTPHQTSRPSTPSVEDLSVASVGTSVSIEYFSSTRLSRQRMDVVVNTYRNVKRRAADAAAQRRKPVCDGCGIFDTGREHGLTMVQCLDKQCKSLSLCLACHVHANYRHRSHSHTHAVETLQQSDEPEAHIDPLQLDDVLTAQQPHLTLGDFTCYVQPDINQLVVCQGAPHSMTATLLTLDNGAVTAHTVAIATRGEAFVCAPNTNEVWVYTAAHGKLERWSTLPSSSHLLLDVPKVQHQQEAVEEKKEREEEQQLVEEHDVIDPLQCAVQLLHNCLVMCNTPALLLSYLNSILDILDLLCSFSSTHMAAHQIQLYNILIGDSLRLLSTIFDRLTACGVQNLTMDTKPIMQRTRVLLEHTILELVPSGERLSSIEEPAVRVQAFAAFVSGFEFFYPTFKSRVQRIDALLHMTETHSSFDSTTANELLHHILIDYYAARYNGLLR